MDSTDFSKLVSQYSQRVYAFAVRLSGNEDVAEDATQEAFIKAWKNRAKYDPAKGFQPWIFAIARNATLDILRKRKDLAFSRLEESVVESFGEDIPADQEPITEALERLATQAVVEETLKELTFAQRTAVYLHDVEGRTFDEISQITGKPLNTEKSHYRRAIIALRKKLAPKLGRDA